MWGKKSPKPVHHHHRKNFSCTSFKDIHLLVSEDNHNNPSSKPHKSPSIFHRVRLVNSLLRSWSTHLPTKQQLITLPNTEDRVVIYYTSLRVVRSTSEDCRTVRSILRSFPVLIDERDVSMDHTYLSQLHHIFPHNKNTLPKVFISGRYVGGAEEIRNLHESGELKNLLAGLPVLPRGRIGCEVCDGVRFLLCEECSGSRKCYSEKSGFRTCSACNENGLVRKNNTWCEECSGSRKCYSEKSGFRTCSACNEYGLVRCAFCEKVGFRTCSACNENGLVRCGYCG